MAELRYKVGNELIIKVVIVDVDNNPETSYPYEIGLSGGDSDDTVWVTAIGLDNAETSANPLKKVEVKRKQIEQLQLEIEQLEKQIGESN